MAILFTSFFITACVLQWQTYSERVGVLITTAYRNTRCGMSTCVTHQNVLKLSHFYICHEIRLEHMVFGKVTELCRNLSLHRLPHLKNQPIKWGNKFTRLQKVVYPESFVSMPIGTPDVTRWPVYNFRQEISLHSIIYQLPEVSVYLQPATIIFKYKTWELKFLLSP